MDMKRVVPIGKNTIPGVFTLFNFFFGFLAVIVAAQGHYGKAAWLILGAALFDALDGKLARLLGTPSRFGLEFDSIADLVSFCTAPAVIVYFAYLGDLHPVLAAAISFVPLFAGGFRLARFNVQSVESPLPFFVGLSSPAHALTLASFVLFNLHFYNSPGDPRIALPLVFVLSFLMVSHIRYPKIPNIGKGIRGKIRAAVLLVIVGALVWWRDLVLFPMAILYVAWGVVHSLFPPEKFEAEVRVGGTIYTNIKNQLQSRKRHKES